ncbi:hypothetical protein VPNG_06740 [Cytospora leucostoma]|uniref:Uncharacterized protein n=1 Tax=Cytospora leucostoma TaxID=1230097 RepID=A0A423WT08_9PEZI|nr:hypothetical protein VPNG_06740 [Cytospora leucostoma]
MVLDKAENKYLPRIVSLTHLFRAHHYKNADSDMRLSTVIVGLAALIGITLAGPTRLSWNTSSPAIDGFGLTTEDMENALIAAVSPQVHEMETGALAERHGLPPRDRLLAEQIELDDLPSCYKVCMQQEDGKSSIHMGKVCN